jgi:hypothetical protein
LSSSYARHTPAVSIIAKRADFPSLHQLSIQQMAQMIIDDVQGGMPVSFKLERRFDRLL